MSKILVAFFSRRGQNYVGRDIVDLPVGNTELVARKVAESLGADLFRVETKEAYPDDYTEATKKSSLELKENARPELTARLENMSQYDTIVLGYPNWCGTMPMGMYTFLESYDLSGKRIVPFCTHEGSGLGNSVSDIERLARGAEVTEGVSIHGGQAGASSQEVEQIVRLAEGTI